jgi:hypothetical protein
MAVNAASVGRGESLTNTVTTAAGACTTGDTLAAFISFDPTTTISGSVADLAGNTYSLKDTLTTSSNAKLAVYVKENATGHAANTLTVNFSGNAFAVVHLIKITGVGASSYDAGAEAKTVDTTDPGTVTSGTLAQANEVVVAIYDWNGNGGTGAYTSSNFTLISQQDLANTYWSSCVGKLVVSSTAAVTPSFSKTTEISVGDRGLIVVAFKEGTATATSEQVENSARPRPGRGPFSVGRFFVSTPDAITSAAAAPQSIAVPLGTLSLTGLVPTVTATANNAIAVPAGTMTLSGKVPTVTATANNAIAVPLATLTLTGNVPTVTATQGNFIAVPAGSLTLNGQVPTVTATQGNFLAIPAGSLTLTGLAPTVQNGANNQIAVPAGSLTLNGLVPTVTATANNLISVPLGTLTLTGIAPAVQTGGPQSIDVPLAVISITAYAPDVIVSSPPLSQTSMGGGSVLKRKKRRREDAEFVHAIDALIERQSVERQEIANLAERIAQVVESPRAIEQLLAKADIETQRQKAVAGQLKAMVQQYMAEEEKALIFFLNQ